MSIVTFSELFSVICTKSKLCTTVHILVLVMNTGTILFGSLPHRIHAPASWACTQTDAAQEAST
jgi:nitrate reductase gamma subunit